MARTKQTARRTGQSLQQPEMLRQAQDRHPQEGGPHGTGSSSGRGQVERRRGRPPGRGRERGRGRRHQRVDVVSSDSDGEEAAHPLPPTAPDPLGATLYAQTQQDPEHNVCDVRFRFPCNHVVHAHRAVLMGNSEYFRNMFSSGMAETQGGEIVIQDDPIEAFRLFLKFTYIGSALFTPGGDIDTLAAHNQECLFSFMQLCNKYSVPEGEGSVRCVQSLLNFMSRSDDDAVNTIIRAFDADTLAPIMLNHVARLFIRGTSQDRQRMKNHFQSEEHQQLYIKVLETTLDESMLDTA